MIVSERFFPRSFFRVRNKIPEYSFVTGLTGHFRRLRGIALCGYLEDSIQVGKVGTCQLTHPPSGRAQRKERVNTNTQHLGSVFNWVQRLFFLDNILFSFTEQLHSTRHLIKHWSNWDFSSQIIDKKAESKDRERWEHANPIYLLMQAPWVSHGGPGFRLLPEEARSINDPG